MLCFGVALNTKADVDATHRLEAVGRYVAGHQLGVAQGDACVQDLALHLRGDIGLTGHLVIGHDHAELGPEVFFIKTKGLCAVAAIVEIGADLH